MKFIIVGLGSFGASLAEKLTNLGHEVIGVDIQMGKIEALKDKITHTICLDSTDPQAINNLPLKDTDIVMICIGENEGANILSTTLMKQMKVKRLISRAVSPIHETILEAMQIEEIVHPEEETAERWAKKLNMRGVIDSFELASGYSIIEAKVPKIFIGKSLKEIGLRSNYHVILMTTIKVTKIKNVIGINKERRNIQDVASGDTILCEGDIMVLYGQINKIKKVLDES